MNTETCLHCTHADFRDAAAKGFKGHLTCPTVVGLVLGLVVIVVEEVRGRRNG
jgi:hypothetical protein|nr:MAG TPA: hypothetical protein [Caudoviricetes sp.]